MENNLDYKELGGSIVFWKVNDASQSFEISRGVNGRVGVEFVEGDFTDKDFDYGIKMYKNSSANDR